MTCVLVAGRSQGLEIGHGPASATLYGDLSLAADREEHLLASRIWVTRELIDE